MLEKDLNLSVGIAAIKTLLLMLKSTKFATIQELQSQTNQTVKLLRETDKPITAVVSGCELFSRFITLGSLDDKPMEECQKMMVARGDIFLKRLLEGREIIAKQFCRFVTDNCAILTHSRSRVVLEALKKVSQNCRIHVYVTRSAPDNDGAIMQRELTEAGIKSTLILDSAIGYIMESVDMVLVGAEGVVESGGIINRLGTYMMAVCAKEMKKPFYALTECFKFTRLFPLNQKDVPNDYKFSKASLRKENSEAEDPLVDYTPPSYITLIFTDLGILTPSAVSDELIKLYL